MEGPFSVSDLVRAASQPHGNSLLTKSGRALQKHTARATTAFSPPSGTRNPENYNKSAAQLVQQILTHPLLVYRAYFHAHFGQVHEYLLPNGGIRYDGNGQFLGFLEP